MSRFFIEQIALYPPNPAKAIALLTALGLDEWSKDLVVARGEVFGSEVETNVAALAFNYQATWFNEEAPASTVPKPLELEVLHYEAGRNWMREYEPSVSHLGMHCTSVELHEWRRRFEKLGIGVAQEVFTQSHSNPAIAGKRWYQYVIFDTRRILGVDLKFIVRMDRARAVV